MPEISIKYCFELKELKRREIIELTLDDKTIEPTSRNVSEYHDWMRLEYNQCSHCPLESESNEYCPVALSLAGVIEKFSDVTSHDEVRLMVMTSDRNIAQSTTAQRAISSLIGLLIATSGCPYSEFLKPLARFHLPLASEEETMFRAAGSYLLAQFFLDKDGNDFDTELGGLRKIYDDMHLVNTSIADRVRSATVADSSVNAVVLLDMSTNLMPYVIEDHLNDIRHLFDAYLRAA
ncbi:MAG: hypothetical protein WBO73_03555 [Gammaproteobacteria bacterium]|jgi:hypothetical protein